MAPALQPNRAAEFIAAQDRVYADVLAQLKAGRKSSHWIWFIFPQLKALGRSGTAKRFGLADLEEAQAYAAHPVLGGRLRECVALATAIEDSGAQEIFGTVDALKFRSCLTLFLRATGEELFRTGLAKYYGGVEDPLTTSLLAEPR
jgi:uncharacterized protein (DUF1810 family)